jgi:hypothetical protein
MHDIKQREPVPTNWNTAGVKNNTIDSDKF